MKSFARRRARNLLLSAAIGGAMVVVLRAQDQVLGDGAVASGLVLYGAIGFLALYHLRKKLPMLPLGTSAAWLQVHIYVGLVSIALFLLHIELRIPNGIVEVTLALLYLATVTSGIGGLYLSRTIPPRLRRAGEEVIYEQVGRRRQQLATGAHTAVLEAVSATGSTTLADFYVDHLYDYLEHARPWWHQLRPTFALRRRLMHRLGDLQRYLAPAEQSASEQLFNTVRKKDDLDFQQSCQGILKWWLFGHIALTYALVAVASVHGILALAFGGGIP